MTPREIATRLVREKFQDANRITFENPADVVNFVVFAIEQDRAANAPLIAAAEAYREAWHAPPYEDLIKATALLRAATHGVTKTADFSKEPWNV